MSTIEKQKPKALGMKKASFSNFSNLNLNGQKGPHLDQKAQNVLHTV